LSRIFASFLGIRGDAMNYGQSVFAQLVGFVPFELMHMIRKGRMIVAAENQMSFAE